MTKPKQTRTHWKQLIDKRFIGVYSLPNGEDMTVTIRHCEQQEVTFKGGTKELKMLIWFNELKKPMICNPTNGTIIQGLYGWAWEGWVGKRITLTADTTKMGREIVECLRVREKIPDDGKPTEALSEARLAVALEKIVRGEYSADTLRAKFALTDAQLARVAEAETAFQTPAPQAE